jgi:hypothetical protein
MGQGVAARTDFTAGEVRRFAKRAEGRRAGAPTACDRSGSRWRLAGRCSQDRWVGPPDVADWVIRFNEQGPEGLTNIASSGAPPKLGVGGVPLHCRQRSS